MITITDTWPLPFSAEIPGTYRYEFTTALSSYLKPVI
jgi:hypothetical protein